MKQGGKYPWHGFVGFIIFDEFNPKELAIHIQFWPKFLEARSKGLKAKLCRAKLYVNGTEIKP